MCVCRGRVCACGVMMEVFPRVERHSDSDGFNSKMTAVSYTQSHTSYTHTPFNHRGTIEMGRPKRGGGGLDGQVHTHMYTK